MIPHDAMPSPLSIRTVKLHGDYACKLIVWPDRKAIHRLPDCADACAVFIYSEQHWRTIGQIHLTYNAPISHVVHECYHAVQELGRRLGGRGRKREETLALATEKAVCGVLRGLRRYNRP